LNIKLSELSLSEEGDFQQRLKTSMQYERYCPECKERILCRTQLVKRPKLFTVHIRQECDDLEQGLKVWDSIQESIDIRSVFDDTSPLLFNRKWSRYVVGIMLMNRGN
jgi:hypothetical protein